MKVSQEDGKLIVWGDIEGWEQVGDSEMYEKGRWTTSYYGLFRHLESDVVYSMCWQEGSTECQDDTEMFWDDPELTEMVQKEITTTQWVNKETS